MGKKKKKVKKVSANGKPFVSVCTPTYNRGRFIPFLIKCFESQTYPKSLMEWVIIDDGEESVEELFKAKNHNALPSGVYEATKHVPFPHPDEALFSEKFDPIDQKRIKQWVESVKWYEFGVNEENVTKLFSALPELMHKFRVSVKKDLANQTLKLSDRLPEQYIDAYKSLDE